MKSTKTLSVGCLNIVAELALAISCLSRLILKVFKRQQPEIAFESSESCCKKFLLYPPLPPSPPPPPKKKKEKLNYSMKLKC